VNPIQHDPKRQEHFIQSKLDLEKSSGILRMTNFTLGSTNGAKTSSYAETFTEKTLDEPRVVHKRKDDSSIHNDRILAR
jgi:hypothetical protein